MKNILMALAATTALAAAAAPAAAQSWRGDNNYRDYNRGYSSQNLTSSYVDSLEWKLNNAAQQRMISRRDARQLIYELRQVQPLANRVETGRASRWEQERLQQTVSRIESVLNSYARNDRRRDDRRWDDRRWDDRRDDRRDRDYGYGDQYRR